MVSSLAELTGYAVGSNAISYSRMNPERMVIAFVHHHLLLMYRHRRRLVLIVAVVMRVAVYAVQGRVTACAVPGCCRY